MPALKINPIKQSEDHILALVLADDTDGAAKEVLKLMKLCPRQRKLWEKAAKSAGSKSITSFISSALNQMNHKRVPCKRPIVKVSSKSRFSAKTL